MDSSGNLLEFSLIPNNQFVKFFVLYFRLITNYLEHYKVNERNRSLQIVIRADASDQIGSGHIMRCLTLADILRERGAEVYFVCRELPGHLGAVLKDKGYLVHWLSASGTEIIRNPNRTSHSAWLGTSWEIDAKQTQEWLMTLQEVDWLIVDHYALDLAWELQLQPLVKRIIVIDDLADRPHECDLLLDQNLYRNMNQRYIGLVPKRCRLLLGPRYALLRSEFIEARNNLRQRDGVVRRILVFFSGSDPSNETIKALRTIQLLERPDIIVDVVVGSSNQHKLEIEESCAKLPNTNFYCQISNMADLMERSDLAIGGCGVSALERCAVALPTLVIALARNQQLIAENLMSIGAIDYIGIIQENIYEKLLIKLREILLNPSILKKMSIIAMQVTCKIEVHRIGKLLIGGGI